MLRDVGDKSPTSTRICVYTNTYIVINTSNISTITISIRKDMHDNTHIQTVVEEFSRSREREPSIS